MSRLILNNGAAPSTPASGKISLYSETNSKHLYEIDDSGAITSVTPIANGPTSAVNQNITTTTRTYLSGSQIIIPASKCRIGTTFLWNMSYAKNANGTATSLFDVAFGTAGTTADTARISFTKPIGTAAADEAWVQIMAQIQGPLSASCIAEGLFSLNHNLATTGHITTSQTLILRAVATAFDITTVTSVGLCLTAGASDNVTFRMMSAQAWNL